MRVVLMTFLFFSVVGAAYAQLPAQRGRPGSGMRPSAPPEGQPESTEPSSTNETRLKRYKQRDDRPQEKAVSAIAEITYMVGVRGYPSSDGFVVLSTIRRPDLNQLRKSRCAAEEIEVDFQGNGKFIKVRLERGDKITSINGYQVKTTEELSVAVQSADDPHAIDITFIDWRSGNEYTGRLNAMKIK